MTEIVQAVKRIPEVIQAHRMTGDTCFLAVVAVTSTAHLEKVMDQLSRYGQAHTSIVVSTPVKGRFAEPEMLEKK